MLEILSGLNNEQYNLFIQFMLKRSDVFTFFLPNFQKKMVTVDNKKMFDDLEIGTTICYDDGENFLAYKQCVAPRIELIEKNIIRRFIDVKYCGDIYNYECEIYVVKIDNTLNDDFFSVKGLWDWKYPYFPEDICFYKNKKCFMRSIAHEEMCMIYDSDQSIISFLDKIGVTYWESPDEEVPNLPI